MRRLVRSQEGMTLIEMLSAMAVFSFVVGMFAVILSSAIRHSDDIDEQATLQVQARRAIGSVSSDLRQAYDGDANPDTSPIETMTSTQLTFLSPDRQQPFHMRRVSYRLSGGNFQRVEAISSDTDGVPWLIPSLGSYRNLAYRVASGSGFSYKKEDGTTATSAVDVKTVDVTLILTTATQASRQFTHKTTITIRGES